MRPSATAPGHPSPRSRSPPWCPSPRSLISSSRSLVTFAAIRGDRLRRDQHADQFQTVVDSYKADGIPYRVEDTGVAWSVWVADPDGFQVEVTCYYFPV